MESINLTNTLAGLAAIQRAMAGEDILFTKLEIGDGVLTDTDVSKMTGLINKTKDYVLGAVDAEDSEIVRLRSNLSNDGVTQDLIIREYGIYAKFGEEQEFLFAYLNTGNVTTPLPSERIGRYELNRDFVLYIGNSLEVDFKTNGHLIYVTISQYKNDMKGKANIVGTIEELKASKKYAVGDIVQVLGYYEPGDTGAHSRQKVHESSSGIDIINANDGSKWKIIHNGVINISWLGVKSTFNQNELLAFKKILFDNDEITVHLLPEDIIPNFEGVGIVNVIDIYGKIHVCKVENLRLKNSNENTFIRTVSEKKTSFSIGVIGDSITDGGRGLNYTPNPEDSDAHGSYDYPNLISTNYNHSLNGGYNSYVAKFGRMASDLLGVDISIYNCASSAKRLINGWAYRNLDYGFFQNEAYGKEIPSLMFMAMAMNDIFDVSRVDEYKDKITQFVRKCNFYGSEVIWLIPVKPQNNLVLECLEEVLPNINVKLIKLYEYFNDYEKGDLNTFDELWYVLNENKIDTVHPSNSGHTVLGNILLYNLFKNKIVHITEGRFIDPARNSNISISGRIKLYATENDPHYGRVVSSAGLISPNSEGKFTFYCWNDKAVDLIQSLTYINKTSKFEYDFKYLGADKNVKFDNSFRNEIGVANNKWIWQNKIISLPYGLTKITCSITSLEEGCELPVLTTVKSEAENLGKVKMINIANDVNVNKHALSTETIISGYNSLNNIQYLNESLNISFNNLSPGESLPLFSNGKSNIGLHKFITTTLELIDEATVQDSISLVDLSDGTIILTIPNTNSIIISKDSSGIYLYSEGIKYDIDLKYGWIFFVKLSKYIFPNTMYSANQNISFKRDSFNPNE